MADSNLSEATVSSAVKPTVSTDLETSRNLESEKAENLEQVESSRKKGMDFERELLDAVEATRNKLGEMALTGDGTLAEEELQGQIAANKAMESQAGAQASQEQEVARLNQLKTTTILATRVGIELISRDAKVTDATGRTYYDPELALQSYYENMPQIYDSMLETTGGNDVASGLGMYYIGNVFGANPDSINSYRSSVFIPTLKDEEQALASQNFIISNIYGTDNRVYDSEGALLSPSEYMTIDDRKALISTQGTYKPLRRFGDKTKAFQAQDPETFAELVEISPLLGVFGEQQLTEEQQEIRDSVIVEEQELKKLKQRKYTPYVQKETEDRMMIR